MILHSSSLVSTFSVLQRFNHCNLLNPFFLCQLETDNTCYGCRYWKIVTIQYTYCISLWCWFSFCSFYSSVKEPKLCFLETRLTCIFLGFQVRLRLRRERVQRAGVQVYRPSPRTVNIRRRDGHLLCLWTGTRFWFLTTIFSDNWLNFWDSHHA